MPIRGLVISDLHLLARRSIGESLLDSMNPQFENCEVLVLNGDTFDFRWSTLRNEKDSITAAINWLEERIGILGDRELHFIQGNHDCVHGFCKGLVQLEEKWQNFHVHEYALRLGDQIFLHGDCANRKMDKAALAKTRQDWADDKPRGAFSATLYDVADLTGMSLAFHKLYFPRNVVVARIAHHLDDTLPGWRDSASDCYFGHTHMPFRDHLHEGIRFHNTGSAIRSMGFQPIEFEFEKLEEISG